MSALGERGSSPKDLVSAGVSCRRMAAMATHPEVLAGASMGTFSVSARSWGPAARRHLAAAAELGNLDACYMLGMIEFYCDGQRRQGIRQLVRAAQTCHPAALHSLAIIFFNGSGDRASDRNLALGVLLCASAAQQGHVEALRELGHCLQDGYGVAKNVSEGRRLLLEANLREFARQSLACDKFSSVLGDQLSKASSELLRHVQAAEEDVAGALHMEAEPVAAGDVLAIPGRAAGPAAVVPVPAGVPPMTPRSKPVDGAVESPADALPAQVQAVDSFVSHVAMPFSMPSTADGAGSSKVVLPVEDAQGGTQEMDAATLLRTLCECLGPLMSDFGCTLPRQPPHPANKFLLDWASLGNELPDGLKLCGNAFCGRPETRAHEFRCCAVCSAPSYCSRACQALDWKAGHMLLCQQEVLALQAQQVQEDVILRAVPAVGALRAAHHVR